MYLVTLELDLRFIQGKRAPLSPTGCYLALKQIRGLKKANEVISVCKFGLSHATATQLLVWQHSPR